MVVKTIVHFDIPAGDPAKLSKFYSTVFGWKFTKSPVPGVDYWLISTGPRNRSVGGGMYKREGPADLPRNYISVDRIDESIETFKSAGGREVMGKQEIPKTGWSFIGADPDGNLIALFQSMRRPRARRVKKRGK